jgi:DNA-directed RNA polymerase specialized sigma24 family protein
MENPRAFLMRNVLHAAIDQRRSTRRRQARELRSTLTGAADDVDVPPPPPTSDTATSEP